MHPYPKQYTFASTFFALFAVFFLVVISNTLPILAGLYIVGDLGGSTYTTIYGVAFFGVGNAIGVPLGFFFAERIGIVKFLIICLVLFAFFAWACGAASTYPLFIIFRLLSGVASGPFYSLIFKLFALIAPQEKKRRFSSILLTMFVTVPTLGGTWGGWIAYDYHWRWIFYINVPIILALALFIGVRLRGFDPPPKHTPFDWVGYCFYCIAILSVGCVLIMGQELDWYRSSLINILSLIGLLTTLFFILWEYHYPDPLIDLQMLKNIGFLFALTNLVFLFSAYFGMVILLSLWLHLYVNYTPIWIGLLLGIMVLTGLFPKQLIENKLSQMDCRIPLSIAILFLAISSFYTMFFNVEINFGRIALSRLFAGIGLAFFLPPIFRLCFHTFPEEKIQNFLIPFQFVRTLSGGIGASLYTILWQRRQVFYNERLGSKLTVFSHQTQTFFANAERFYLRDNRAKEQLDVFLDRQATSLALDDCFYLMGWIMVGLLMLNVLSLLAKKENFFPEKYHTIK